MEISPSIASAPERLTDATVTSGSCRRAVTDYRRDARGLTTYRYADEMGVDVPHPLHAPRVVDTHEGNTGSLTTFHYDDWGNLAKSNRANGIGTVEEKRVLRWDAENRLAALTTARRKEGAGELETVDADYIYDRSGARIAKRAPRLGDAGDPTQREVSFYASEILTRRWNDNTAALQVSAGGKPLVSMRLAKTGQDTERLPYFYHSELPNGSVTAVTRPAGDSQYQGELIERLEYRPYGEIIERNRLIGSIESGSTVAIDKLAPSRRRSPATVLCLFRQGTRLGEWLSLFRCPVL